jgi:hypothetical protein
LVRGAENPRHGQRIDQPGQLALKFTHEIEDVVGEFDIEARDEAARQRRRIGRPGGDGNTPRRPRNDLE